MPIHEYRCRTCGNCFEELVLSTPEPLVCPVCGADDIEPLLSAPAPTSSGAGTRVPDAAGHGCCGSRPGEKGCVPGSCCGKS